jgi:3-isopropylmalate dehydrogenase
MTSDHSTTIAVLPGDGIGPEVTHAALAVMRAVRPDLEYVEAKVGAAALEAGLPPLPDETRALCDRSAAILFGAVGSPLYDDRPLAERPEAALFSLRHDYELFANIRPVRVFPGLEGASSLHRHLIDGLDLVVIRELTGGIYFGQPKEQRTRDGDEEAVDTMFYRAREVERIARVAFELAMRRKRRVISVDKQNILATSGLWRRVVTRVAAQYPDVDTRHLLVDTAAMQLVRRPREFDVILTENMFGDILSDEAAMLSGSIGNLPSASLGTRGGEGRTFGMYEPISGSAPDIAGKGVANPTGAILSAALLLRHSLHDDASARRIEVAVERCFREGARTADLQLDAGGAALTTSAFANAVIERL